MRFKHESLMKVKKVLNQSQWVAVRRKAIDPFMAAIPTRVAHLLARVKRLKYNVKDKKRGAESPPPHMPCRKAAVTVFCSRMLPSLRVRPRLRVCCARLCPRDG